MKVLIISGMQTIREKLKQLMEAQPDVETVKEAEDNLSGLQVISRLRIRRGGDRPAHAPPDFY